LIIDDIARNISTFVIDLCVLISNVSMT